MSDPRLRGLSPRQHDQGQLRPPLQEPRHRGRRYHLRRARRAHPLRQGDDDHNNYGDNNDIDDNKDDDNANGDR